MTNPAQAELPQPTPMQEHLDLTLDQDNGGVHLNSGIVNHAAYLARLWYRVHTEYLLRQTEFADAAQRTQDAASSGGPLQRGTGADGANFDDTSSACQTSFAAISAPWTLVALALLAARRRSASHAPYTEKPS